MKARCIRAEVSRDDVQRLGHLYGENQSFGLVPGTTYVVFGISFLIAAPWMGTGTYYYVIDGTGRLVLAPSLLFEVEDGRPSPEWRFRAELGEGFLWPPLFREPFFHDDFSSGVPSAVERFSVIRRRIEAEG